MIMISHDHYITEQKGTYPTEKQITNYELDLGF